MQFVIYALFIELILFISEDAELFFPLVTSVIIQEYKFSVYFTPGSHLFLHALSWDVSLGSFCFC